MLITLTVPAAFAISLSHHQPEFEIAALDENVNQLIVDDLSQPTPPLLSLVSLSGIDDVGSLASAQYFEVRTGDSDKDEDTDTGYWDVAIENWGEEDGTVTVSAVSSIGTTVTETTEKCTVSGDDWNCDVAAGNTLDIKFSTSIAHICGQDLLRLRVT